MVSKPRKQESESPAEWLEGELRETKARLHKVEGELEQALKRVWAMDADLRKLTEALAVSGSVAATLVALREDVRQLHDQMGKLQDRQSTLTNRTEEFLRQRQAAITHDRQELGVLAKQLDGLGRGIGQFESRIQALEDVARHLEEDISGTRLADQGLERSLEDITTRLARTHEATVRLDQETAGFAAESEKLKKVDDEVADHLRLITEHARRLGERLDKLESLAAFPEEAREQLQRATFERDQMNQRLATVERLAGDIAERIQDFVQTAARLDQRSQQQGTALLEMTQRLQDTAEQSAVQLKKLYQIMLRQRKRQAENITQEIKELSHGELHAGD